MGMKGTGKGAWVGPLALIASLLVYWLGAA